MSLSKQTLTTASNERLLRFPLPFLNKIERKDFVVTESNEEVSSLVDFSSVKANADASELITAKNFVRCF